MAQLPDVESGAEQFFFWANVDKQPKHFDKSA